VIETVRVRITGRVQGVGFRGWTQAEAEARGLDGWVRNEPDGSVTAFLSGRGELVRDMLSALREGPPLARVESVVTELAEKSGENGFHVLK
jgi:acylphosphatase